LSLPDEINLTPTTEGLPGLSEPPIASKDVGSTGTEPCPLPAAQSARQPGDGAVSGAAMIISARILGIAISLLSVAIVARILTPADYGIVAMVLSVTAFLMVFSDLGLSYVTIQRPQISQEQLSALFWANVTFGLAFGAVTALLAPGLVWFYHDSRLLQVTLALAAVFPLAGLGVQHQALLKRRMQFRRYALAQVVGILCGSVVGVALALAGFGYWALVCQSLGIVLTTTAAAWVSAWWFPGPPRRCKDLREMLTFGGRLTAHGMVGYFSNGLDKVLVGRFCGAHALGLYSAAYRLMTKSFALGGHGVGEAAIPAMSRGMGDGDKLRRTYHRMLQFTYMLYLPVGVVCIACADDIVLTLLGSQWLQVVPILRLLFLAAIPRMLIASTGWVYIAGGRVDRMLRWQVFWSLFAAVAFIIGLPWGALGVAGAYALSNWIVLIPGFLYCFRATVFKLGDVIRPSTRPLLCVAIAGSVLVVVRAVISPGLTAGPLRLLPQLCVFGVAYAVTTGLFVPLGNEALVKAIGLLRQLIHSRGRAAHATELSRSTVGR